MKKKTIKSVLATLLVAATTHTANSVLALAADEEVLDLVYFETQGNGVSVRSDAMIPIEHYEIPLSQLDQDVASRIPADVKNSLIFTKNGQPHVRWIINPEDTRWHQEVETWLRAKGLSADRHRHFQAYMTASRSYIIEDPVTKAQFSAKVSTNQTGGAWRDKKQPIDDAKQVRMANDFINDELRRQPLTHGIIMDEPAMFGIRDIDQAMLVRTLADLTTENKYYLPGFSALHERVGREIARRNGATNPQLFWNEHYNKPLAKALAEAAARFGLTYDSPHSQNFLVELDSQFRPTGKIVLRDIGDSYAMEDFFQAKGMRSFLTRWERENIVHGQLSMAVGLLHGNNFPSWISEQEYMQWGREFYETFEAEYSRMTGIPATELTDRMWVSGRYFSKTYQAHTPGWRSYFNRLSGGRGGRTAVGDARIRRKPMDYQARKCQQVFATFSR